MQTKEQAYQKLQKSQFRARFYLTSADREYIADKGILNIRIHACDFVRDKIAPAHPVNDGKQTPMKGHPVFKAMHATAFCCRDCMNKWYRVPKGVPLTPDQQKRIVEFLMFWITKQLHV